MISIITPVFNEEKNVGPFMAHLESLEGDFELILVDGGSSDGTVKEALDLRESFSRGLKILKSRRGRGTQMNEGAKIARGDVLLFLHVDCSLKKDSLALIEKAVYENNASGGAFKQSFYNPGYFLKFQSAFGNMRAGLTRVFYGDYGIFLKKQFFGKIGGYDEIPFLEDVELCRKAKRHGRLIQIDRRIETSPRRYFKKGKVKLTIVFVLANIFNIFRWRPRFLWKYIVDM